MNTVLPYMFSDFFGGHWPMFQGQGTLTYDEFRRTPPTYGRYTVTFKDPGDLIGYMWRSFDTKEAMLAYMKEWGLGATDIDHIEDYSPQMVTRWVVLAHDPFYGKLSGEGYRRRWYFKTKEEADRFAAQLGKPWHLDDVYPIQRERILNNE